MNRGKPAVTGCFVNPAALQEVNSADPPPLPPVFHRIDDSQAIKEPCEGLSSLLGADMAIEPDQRIGCCMDSETLLWVRLPNAIGVDQNFDEI